MSTASALMLATAALAGCGAPTPARSPSAPFPSAQQPVAGADFAPPVEVVAAASDGPLPFTELPDAAWIGRTADATGIPARALQAYASATITSNRENPGCGASWNTLAGLGRAESAHGTVFGGSIEADGFARPEIHGIPLDGSGVADIPDSDAGEIDGDPTIDRAVGPMQIIPDTWRNWHVDANGDGVQSPHQIDDAALAAVHYLCRAGGELTDENGWRTAIIAWNRSETYLLDVGGWANRYAEDAAGA